MRAAGADDRMRALLRTCLGRDDAAASSREEHLAVACLAWVLQAERLGRVARQRRAAAGYRRLARAILAADAATHDAMATPAGAGRGSGR